MFGEQSAAVLHSHIQSAPVELHEGNGELEPAQAEPQEHIYNRPLDKTATEDVKQSEQQQDSRLVVNRVQGLLERVSFPPARPPFVREQVEADVRVRAVVSERDQVSAEGSKLESENTDLTWSQQKKRLRVSGVHLQPWTTTMSLFLWELCLTVSWTSPSGK